MYTLFMNVKIALTWSWMNILSRKRYDLLVGKFGDIEKALEAIDLEMLRQLGCREDAAMKAMNRLDEFDAVTYAAAVQKRGLTLITIEDDQYPQSLRTIEDPPVFLYFRGDLSILSQPCLALVGAREMSEYGKRVTEAFVPEVVRAGMVTVSGLAYGIDAAVAKETLQAGGRTVGVLGHGMAQMYPKGHTALADEIIKKGGLLLSEFPLDQPPDNYTFPARNRIIAGLSLGTVVLEAAEGSGSLITAELALDYNREVFAVPGPIFDPHYGGCHQLISTGQARLVSSAAQVLQEIGIVAAEHGPSSFLTSSPTEQAVFDALTSMPQPVDDLVLKAGIEAAAIGATLTMLELQGAVKNVGGGKWVRR